MAFRSAWAGVGLPLLLAGCPDDPVSTVSDGASSSGDTSSGSSGRDSTSSGGGSSDDGLDTTADGTTTGDPPPPEIDPIPDPPGLAANAFGTCLVDDDGIMTCWGDGNCGLLADGDDIPKPPAQTAVDWSWASIRSGRAHSCGIADDRSLWCWGDGRDGKVGDGVLDDGFPLDFCRFELMEVAPGSTWARVSLGWDHSCGVQMDGTLWCWGSNDAAQIGDGAVGPLFSRLVPVEVGGTAWIDVYAGDAHTCGLDGAGVTWCWGSNNDGALGVQDVNFSSVPVEVPGLPAFRELAGGGSGRNTCGITMDGAAWCWGENQFGAAGVGVEGPVFMPTDIELPAPAAGLYMGINTACAWADSGQAWCWGLGSAGQLGDGVAEQGHTVATPIALPGDSWIDLVSGVQHVCGRTSDGQTLCLGENSAGQLGDETSGADNGRLVPVVVGQWGGGPVASDWADGTHGGSHACGRRLDGSLWCWGQRSNGQLGNADPLDDCSPANPSGCVVTTPLAVSPAGAGAWQQLELGTWHGCALQDDGTLWCWGENGAGQLGNAGVDAPVPTQVGAASDWLAIDLGDVSTCGIRSPGSLWCWGGNNSGVLGIGDTGSNETAPVQVGIQTDWTAVAMSASTHGCGIRNGDSLWCWGGNTFGQLGQGTTSDVELPSQVPGSWSTVGVGSRHTCAVATDGGLWCWGRAEDGELGTGPTGDDAMSTTPVQVGVATDWVQITAGGFTSCGRRSDGTAWCWGSNSSGQLGQGMVDSPEIAAAPLQVGIDTDWVDLSAWNSTVCGRRGNELWCWGQNGDGRQGNDTIFTMGTPREVRDDG